MQVNGRLDLTLDSSTPAAQNWKGGKGVFIAEATWGGGTVKLQAISPNGTFIDVPNVSLTANGLVAFDLPPGQIKVSIATATEVYAYAVGLFQ